MYAIKEIEDYWENNKGGPSPYFPVIEYFKVDGEYNFFGVFEQLTTSNPEPQDIYSSPDPSSRILDQQGRIFKFVVHPVGFYYPELTNEIFNLTMASIMVEDLDDAELGKFISLEKFNDFINEYCIK